jgi:hypothetical protein
MVSRTISCQKNLEKFFSPLQFPPRISQESVGDIFQMNLSRQPSQDSEPTDGPIHQRGTLIELLVIISIIGVLVGR